MALNKNCLSTLTRKLCRNKVNCFCISFILDVCSLPNPMTYTKDAIHEYYQALVTWLELITSRMFTPAHLVEHNNSLTGLIQIHTYITS